jgi:hypothetical protein
MDDKTPIYTIEQFQQYTQYIRERPVFDQAYDMVKKYQDSSKGREKWKNLLDITLNFGRQLQKRLIFVMGENVTNELEKERATLKQRLAELTEWKTDPDLEEITQ